MSISAPFTITDQGAGAGATAYGVALAYEIQTAATARNPTWTRNASAGMAAGIWSFKAATGGGAVPLFLNSSLNGLGSGGPFFHDGLA
jgi:hypothetical protein